MGLQDGKYSHLVQNTSHILLLYILNLCLGILKMHFCWIIAPLEKKFRSVAIPHLKLLLSGFLYPWTFLIISVVTLGLICFCAKRKHTITKLEA